MAGPPPFFATTERGPSQGDVLFYSGSNSHSNTNPKTPQLSSATKTRNNEEGYQFKVSHEYVGQGQLANGQWWPLQICLMRNEAHGELEASISGQSNGVAYSVVLSDSGYANVDNGNNVEYCGTSSKTSTPSANTSMYLESTKRQVPVRLIRSAAAKQSGFLYHSKRWLRRQYR